MSMIKTPANNINKYCRNTNIPNNTLYNSKEQFFNGTAELLGSAFYFAVLAAVIAVIAALM